MALPARQALSALGSERLGVVAAAFSISHAPWCARDADADQPELQAVPSPCGCR